MYNINRFIEEKIGIYCDTYDELKEFRNCCRENGIENVDSMDTIDRFYLCGWNDKKYEKDINWGTLLPDKSAPSIMVERGWTLINVRDLTHGFLFPSNESLMEFLEDAYE